MTGDLNGFSLYEVSKLVISSFRISRKGASIHFRLKAFGQQQTKKGALSHIELSFIRNKREPL